VAETPPPDRRDDQETVVRVLVADDHRLFRDGVRALLAVTPDIEIVGEAADADAATALALQLRPDVVLMDLQMPGGGGLAATARVVDGAPDVAVLVLTMFDDDDSVLAAIRAGARGYVLKDSEAEDLVRAVRSAARGEAIFGRSVAVRMLSWFAAPRAATDLPFADLTAGERNVLRLMAQGLSNPAIAAELSISQKTVRNYVSGVFRKLQVADRAQAIVRARQAGLHR
jgi:DNA-binding NarL/FixJ family response regulator